MLQLYVCGPNLRQRLQSSEQVRRNYELHNKICNKYISVKSQGLLLEGTVVQEHKIF
jgi:hypothetical protein